MDTARDVLREALPIKCIEAVFLGAFLTAGWEELQRFPVGFKSSVGKDTYRWGCMSLFPRRGSVTCRGENMQGGQFEAGGKEG